MELLRVGQWILLCALIMTDVCRGAPVGETEGEAAPDSALPETAATPGTEPAPEEGATAPKSDESHPALTDTEPPLPEDAENKVPATGSEASPEYAGAEIPKEPATPLSHEEHNAPSEGEKTAAPSEPESPPVKESVGEHPAPGEPEPVPAIKDTPATSQPTADEGTHEEAAPVVPDATKDKETENPVEPESPAQTHEAPAAEPAIEKETAEAHGEIEGALPPGQPETPKATDPPVTEEQIEKDNAVPLEGNVVPTVAAPATESTTAPVQPVPAEDNVHLVHNAPASDPVQTTTTAEAPVEPEIKKESAPKLEGAPPVAEPKPTEPVVPLTDPVEPSILKQAPPTEPEIRKEETSLSGNPPAIQQGPAADPEVPEDSSSDESNKVKFSPDEAQDDTYKIAHKDENVAVGQTKEKSETLTTGEIVGIALGIAVLVAAAVAVAFLLVQRNKRRQKAFKNGGKPIRFSQIDDKEMLEPVIA